MISNNNYEKFINCGKCVEYCTLGAYEFKEEHGARRPVVKNPYNCVVLCTGYCNSYPVGGIHHTSKEVTQKIIKNLQNVESG
jgi:NAD-dependent dihydropyrimidine dehydrogenase PreA subunit